MPLAQCSSSEYSTRGLKRIFCLTNGTFSTRKRGRHCKRSKFHRSYMERNLYKQVISLTYLRAKGRRGKGRWTLEAVFSS